MSKIKEILVQISENRIEEAIESTLSLVNSESNHFNELILLKSRHNNLKKLDRLRIISLSELQIDLNQIRSALLEIVKMIEDIDKETSSNSSFRETISMINDSERIKILFLSANPIDTNPIRLDKEVREIENELLRSKRRDQFELVKYSAVRIKDLQAGLLDHSPHFVHFAGHGTRQGISLLDNNTDMSTIVKSEPLANLFRLFSNDVACVFLNSCYSQEQGSLIRKFIPNVIGMSSEIPDNTAIEFSTTFYKSIAAGRDIDFSFEFAKNSIDLNDYNGVGTVKLL